VAFGSPDDIKDMRRHEGYTEVLDVETNKTIEVESPKATTKEVLKLKRKAEVPSFLEE
jgi:hypothetical protein